MRAATYIVSTEGGVCLYVGKSSDPMRRIGEHKSSEWSHLARIFKIDWHDNQRDADKEEARLIQLLQPQFNKHKRTAYADLKPVSELISRWPTRADFADAVGAPLELVHKWFSSGRIPSKWQFEVVRAAKAAGHSEIDGNWMVEVHSREATA